MKREEITPQEAYLQTMIFLARAFPHLYFLSKHIRVVYDPKLPLIAVTDGKQIVVSPFWLKLPYSIRMASFVHVLYHILMKHPLRVKKLLEQGYDLETCIVACDVKVDFLITQKFHNREIHEIFAAYESLGIPGELLEKGSVEEIAEWLTDEGQSIAPSVGNDISPEGLGGGKGGQEELESSKPSQSQGGGAPQGEEFYDQQTLNEGSESLIQAKTDEELESTLNKVIRDSLLSSKMAGAKLSAIEELILQALVKPKVDWRAVFRNIINSYIKSNVVQDWKRSSRRFKDLPGSKPITKPKAWVFTDVSRSIRKQEFEQFMSEVIRLSNFVEETTVVTWDTKVTGEWRFKGRISESIVKNIKFKGRGGTKFAPVISKYAKKIRYGDVVIVLTDGYWHDPNTAYSILKRVNALKIIVTTTDKVPPGFDKVLKIGGGGGF